MIATASFAIVLFSLWIIHTECRIGRLEAAKVRAHTPRAASYYVMPGRRIDTTHQVRED